ncbi:MAG: hypothetical protein RIR00_1544 [Pseudomonadota bacterium]
MRFFRRRRAPAASLSLSSLLCLLSPLAAAEEAALATLSIEDLLRTEVTSVLKHTAELADTPAAVTVIRREDIRRLGATTLPDLMRVVPGLHVAQIDNNRWAVAARGFNGFFGSKLLVLVDGRSIYNAVYSGVFWDAFDLPLDNISRIEIIRGPGAALWGSNAVNGIINIVTRTAQETQGGLAELTVGNLQQHKTGLRWGSSSEEGPAWRVYGQSHNRSESLPVSGQPNPGDSSRADRLGFRADHNQGGTAWMLTGEAYQGRSGGAPNPTASTSNDIRGSHLLGRINHLVASGNSLQLQAYVDQSWRSEPASGSVLEQNVFDLDLQQTLDLSANYRVIWGGGHRNYRFFSQNTSKLAFIPAQSDRNVSNLFVQNEWQPLPNALTLTAGLRGESVPNAGWAWQPNLRAMWTGWSGHTLWAAAGHAVRAPNLYETRIDFNGSGILPGYRVLGNPAFQPEKIYSQELGWRAQLSPQLSSDLSLFSNRYRDLQTLEASSPTTLSYFNNGHGRTYGLEWALDWQASNRWQWRSGFSYYHEDLAFSAPPSQPGLISYIGSYPSRQLFLRALIDLDQQNKLDVTWRAVAALSNIRQTPGYGTLDLRWSRHLSKQADLAVIGRNLIGPRHYEIARQPFFQQTVVRPEVLLTLSLRF